MTPSQFEELRQAQLNAWKQQGYQEQRQSDDVDITAHIPSLLRRVSDLEGDLSFTRWLWFAQALINLLFVSHWVLS